MKIRARPRKKSSRRSRGGGGTVEPSNLEGTPCALLPSPALRERGAERSAAGEGVLPAPSVGFATLAETAHEGEGNKSFAGRRWRSRHRRCVVIACSLVTDGIYSDTLRNVAGKNLELTFSKEPAPP